MAAYWRFARPGTYRRPRNAGGYRRKVVGRWQSLARAAVARSRPAYKLSAIRRRHGSVFNFVNKRAMGMRV